MGYHKTVICTHVFDADEIQILIRRDSDGNIWIRIRDNLARAEYRAMDNFNLSKSELREFIEVLTAVLKDQP